MTVSLQVLVAGQGGVTHHPCLKHEETRQGLCIYLLSCGSWRKAALQSLHQMTPPFFLSQLINIIVNLNFTWGSDHAIELV